MDAVVTLISGGEGFYRGAVAQKWLLDQYAKEWPHVVLVERKSYKANQLAYLEKIGWDVREVNAIRSQPAPFAAKRWPRTFTKLQVWSLTEFQHVLYIDADAYPFASLKPFAKYQPENLAATQTLKCKTRFRSGLMLLRTDAEVFSELKAFCREPSQKNGAKLGDQGVLNIHFRNRFDLLPFHYHSVDWQLGFKHVIVGHLRPKPWETTRKCHANMQPYLDRWKKAIADVQKQHGKIPT